MLILVLALQTVVVTVDTPWLTGGALCVAALISIVTRIPARNVRRPAVAIAVMLTPVLFLRLIAAPSVATVIDWAIYLARLLAAVLTAALYLHLRGSAGLRRALHAVLRPLPNALRNTITDMISSTFHLTPILIRRLGESRGAVRVRIGAASRLRPWRPYTVMVRSFLVSVATLPGMRAEAMVVRGLVARSSHTEPSDGRS